MAFDGKSFQAKKINAVFELIDNETKQLRATKKDLPTDKSVLVGERVIFSHRFLEDLEKIWALREYIPDTTKPIYSLRDFY